LTDEVLRRDNLAMRTRREFLALLAAAALPALADVPATMPIVDTHQHLWDLSKFTLPWLKDPKLNKNFLPEDYARDAEGLNVTRAIYMEVEVAPRQYAAEAEWVIDLCRTPGSLTTAAVIGGAPQDESFAAYIAHYKDNPIVKGVRSVYPKGGLGDQQYLTGLRLLGEMNFRYDLLMDGSLLPEAVKVVDACPGTRFILDHCGNATTRFFAPAAKDDPTLIQRRRVWEDGISALADRKNVICKISGVAESGPPELATVQAMSPIINHCLDRFGDDRVVFASNWPVCLKSVTYRRWVDLLNQIVATRSDAFGQKLFSGNARKFYELKG
jgi:predicted TIM-barrel fold metal-dependent hydrolase